MLIPELQKNIDEKWDACWPMSTLRPLVILDLLSYLFFFKKISEHLVTPDNNENKSNPTFINPKEKKLINWDLLKVQEGPNMHFLFTGENGVIDFLKNYNRALPYSEFVKEDLLITPTPKLLINCVGIIKIIEEKDDKSKGEIFEYLLNKVEISGQNGQAYLPEYLIDLIISIIQPEENDWILDPSAGNASFLVRCAKYISDKNPYRNNIDSKRLAGIESDPTNFRIGAMNMLLHGIYNPELKVLNSTASFSSINIEQLNVIVANLIFSASENKTSFEGDLIKDATRKEVLYLNFILKNSKPGTRSAVIVPDTILYNNGTEFITLREEFIDHFKVEAVISLNDKNTSQFFGTSILIFSKEASVITDKVWFYKIEHCKKEINNGNTVFDEMTMTQNNTDENLKQREELADILNHFRNKDHSEESKNPDSFYIDAEHIRSKNYSLSYNELNLFIGQEKSIHLSEISSEEKRVAISNLKNKTLFPAAEKLPEPKKRYLKKILVITFLSIVVLGIGFGAYWVLYLKKDLFNIKINWSKSVIAKDSIISSSPPDTSNLNISNNNSKISDSTNSVNTKYTVVSKAYFYNTPDTNTRRELYVSGLVHAVLIPEKEKNGFVYVVYINKHGQSTRGWLNKKNLKPLP